MLVIVTITVVFPGSVSVIQRQLYTKAHDIKDPARHLLLRAVPAQPRSGGACQHVQRARPRPASRLGHQARPQWKGNAITHFIPLLYDHVISWI